MQYESLPDVTKPVSHLVQGTMMLNNSEVEQNFDLLDSVLDQGGTTFDTAQVYGGGSCERIFGRWLKERGVRDKVVIIAKGAHHSQDRKRVTPFDIASDIHDSLARMQVDHLDIYLLHRDDPAVPIGPIVEALNEHHAAGRIGAFGGSNWTAARLQEANEYAAANGLKPFTGSSPNFSLAVQRESPWADCVSLSSAEAESDRAWYLDNNNVRLFTWSSLAGGFFSGRFERDNLDSFENPYDQLCAKCYGSEENFQRLDRVKILAEEKSMTIPQIATAYVLSHPLNIFALVGCRTPDEFKMNVEASDTKLTDAELAWLELRRETRE